MLFCCLSVWFFLLGGCSLISWPKPCTNSPPSPQPYISQGGEFRIVTRVCRAWTFASYYSISPEHMTEVRSGQVLVLGTIHIRLTMYACLQKLWLSENFTFALPLALPPYSHPPPPLTHSSPPSPSPGHLMNMDQTLHPNAHLVISIHDCTRSFTPMTILNLTRTLTFTVTLTLALPLTNTDSSSH